MFKLFDNYSSPLANIVKKTEDFGKKATQASGQADNFNKKLDKTGASANNASAGVMKIVKASAAYAATLKGMSIVDEYTNTAARLDLINDGLQTQAELQNKIMQSANAAKGSYNDMADAVAKMGLLASESFTSNDELIGFTELLQKSFKLSGAATTEQASAMQQLSQAMAAGKLQGDEFRSIMENAPMLADAIAKYTGKSKGELKELSSSGAITSDVIKNSIFAAADDINSKFEEMPYTFADTWNKIKNGGIQAFGNLMSKVNELLNNADVQNFISAVTTGFSIAADAVGLLIDAVVSGWDLIGPILAIIGTVYLVTIINKLFVITGELIKQFALWAATHAPIFIAVAVIGILTAAFLQLGGTVEEVVGFIGGIIGAAFAGVYNQFVYIWNFVATFVNFLGNVFTSPIASIQALFYDMSSNVCGFILTIAQGIEDLLNAIPFVEVDITSGLSNLQSNLAAKATQIKSEADLKTYVESKDFMNWSDGYSKGSTYAKDSYTELTTALGGLGDKLNSTSLGSTAAVSKLGTASNPTTVKGTGAGGSVKVNMADEDLKYLKDVAERDYINKISSNTLAPNVTITFGDVHENADADKVAGRIKKILQEEIAICAEG